MIKQMMKKVFFDFLSKEEMVAEKAKPFPNQDSIKIQSQSQRPQMPRRQFMPHILCIDFQRGCCKYGDRCKFAHIHPHALYFFFFFVPKIFSNIVIGDCNCRCLGTI